MAQLQALLDKVPERSGSPNGPRYAFPTDTEDAIEDHAGTAIAAVRSGVLQMPGGVSALIARLRHQQPSPVAVALLQGIADGGDLDEIRNGFPDVTATTQRCREGAVADVDAPPGSTNSTCRAMSWAG